MAKGPSSSSDRCSAVARKASTSSDKGSAVARMLFAQFDTGGSGTINAEGLKGLCGVLGIDPAEHATFLEKPDTDHNGEISFDEFVVFWEMSSGGAGSAAPARPAAKFTPRSILKQPQLVESVESDVDRRGEHQRERLQE